MHHFSFVTEVGSDKDSTSCISESPPLDNYDLPTDDSDTDDDDVTIMGDSQSLCCHTLTSTIPPPSWCCSPLNDIRFGPSTYPILPALRSSPSHCVAINTNRNPGKGRPPLAFPSSFKDVWDGDHVRMPCSKMSLYPVSSNHLQQKWELVKTALGKPILDCHALEQAILSYNSRFSSRWKFHQLHHYCDNYITPQKKDELFRTIIPKMVDLVLSLPTLVTHAIPLLRKQQPYSLTLSQQQIACLLANAFFCTFPRRNSKTWGSEYSKFASINFDTLFTGKQFDRKKMSKIDCIINYFRRVTTSVPVGTVTFTRQVCKSPPKWEDCSEQFTKLHVTSDGTIEGCGHGMLQVDFANKYIGGGVLSSGCVQEEIRFLICPELLVSRLFTEELDDNESIVITGAEQYSQYTGYGSTFQWSGDYVDETVRDSWGRRQVQLTAIDALVFRRYAKSQFKPGLVHRELNKAYSGFEPTHTSSTTSGHQCAVATGNWGCGAFGGEPRLKAIIQWMAASVAGRDMVYFTFDKSNNLLEDLKEIHKLITSTNPSIGRVWKTLVEYYQDMVEKKTNSTPLITFMKRHLRA